MIMNLCTASDQAKRSKLPPTLQDPSILAKHTTSDLYDCGFNIGMITAHTCTKKPQVRATVHSHVHSILDMFDQVRVHCIPK
jgi:hypothetical protein